MSYSKVLSEFNIIEGVHENEHRIIIQVAKKNHPSHCPYCLLMANLYKYGTRKQMIVDIPIRSKQVILEINRKRYKCKECFTSFWEPLESVDQRRLMTTRLVKFIERETMKNKFIDVARAIGVNEKTVRNVHKDYVKDKETH
ncbi:transposase family protein [Cytobacillus sp. IB215665]|uniref:transposase family protein n=1 Tax=Cytobacillus sp. IB215665 TaxID=3097357 RepID=UPI002A11F43E|nr:transposase family protein [Cytobacillus sp. IB215665]MDX8364544.1 transposase family protein [Cytobacillus sp. IB215665]